MSWHSDEERRRRQMGSPVWPLKPGPFEWETQPITLAPKLKAKMAETEFEKDAVLRAYSTARDHVTDKAAVMELADDIQYLMLWAWRKGRQP